MELPSSVAREAGQKTWDTQLFLIKKCFYNVFFQIYTFFTFRNNLQCDGKLVKSNYRKKEQWKKEMWNKLQLRNYVQIKEDFYSEPYLMHNLNRWQRSSCAQLRSGPLLVDTKVSLKSSVYVFLCNMMVVENEFHSVSLPCVQ